MSNDLGSFLRGRREALAPAEVGLPVGSRRRTPGLRRAELATLAGVSVDYLTRLERGRDRHPSTEVINTLARALRLSDDEYVYLRMLAKAADGATCGAVAEPPSGLVRPTVRAILDRLEPTPAVVLDRRSDLLAWTPAYERLAGPVGLLEPVPRPNLARFLFTDARARAAFPNWARIADAQVAHLRANAIWDGTYIRHLVDELRAAGPAFAGRWEAPPAVPDRSGVERWEHPEVGAVRLAYESMELAGSDDTQRMVVYLPADDASSTALDRLTGRRPGALRAVAPAS